MPGAPRRAPAGDEHVRPLALLPSFDAFEAEDVRALDRALVSVRWDVDRPPPAEIARADLRLVIVREGVLEWRCVSPCGTDVVVGLLLAGDVVATSGNGGKDALRPMPTAWVSPVSAERLERLLAHIPRLGVHLVSALGAQLNHVAQNASVLSELRVEDRLWGLFIRLARRQGVVTSEGVRLALEFTHLDWARFVGASREAVTAALLRMRRRGTVVCRDRTVILPLAIALPLLEHDDDDEVSAANDPAAVGSAVA